MYKLKTKEEKIKYLEQVNPSDAVRKKMSQLKKSRQAMEVLTPQDSTELRARYILQRLTEMKEGNVDQADRIQFLDELENKKILTPKVREMISTLKNQL
jgi:hypothetical protein